nr:receptor protein kinase-like protein ZAR1 [Ipomoea trifida]
MYQNLKACNSHLYEFYVKLKTKTSIVVINPTLDNVVSQVLQLLGTQRFNFYLAMKSLNFIPPFLSLIPFIFFFVVSVPLYSSLSLDRLSLLVSKAAITFDPAQVLASWAESDSVALTLFSVKFTRRTIGSLQH